MNGLMTQLVRIEAGKDVEEAHMRNRQLIARWAYENGKADNVIEYKKRDGKTYVVVNDYAKLRNLFGTLLAEVQRIKSEGDFAAGKKLVEDYGESRPDLARRSACPLCQTEPGSIQRFCEPGDERGKERQRRSDRYRSRLY